MSCLLPYDFKKDSQLMIDGAMASVVSYSDQELVVQLDSGEMTGRHAVFPAEQIDEMLSTGGLRVPEALISPDGEASIANEFNVWDYIRLEDHEEVNRRLRYIQAIEDIRPSRRTNKSVQAAINEAAKDLEDDNPLSIGSVRRIRREYIDAGRSPAALVPNMSRRAGYMRSERRAESVQLALEFLRKICMAPHAPKVMTAFREYLKEIKRRNRSLPKRERLTAVAQSTFYRLVLEIDPIEWAISRGDPDAELMKVRQYGPGVVVERPLQRVEFDGVTIDLMTLLNRKTRRRLTKSSGKKKVAHRLTVIIAIDCYTRMILGFSISKKGENTEAYNACLMNAMYPWKQKLEEYGIENGSYGAGGLNDIVLDKTAAARAKTFIETLGMIGASESITPVKKPYLKGIVEAAVKKLNWHFHDYPGTTKSNVQARGDYDSEKHAVISDEDFERILYQYFAVEYNNSFHSRLGCTPAEMWREATTTNKVALPPDPVHTAKIFGKHDRRAISGEGVQISRRFYNHPELAAYRKLLESRMDRKTKVIIHPTDPDTVFVKHPDKEFYLEVKYTGAFVYPRPTKNAIDRVSDGPAAPDSPGRDKHDAKVKQRVKDARRPLSCHQKRPEPDDTLDPTSTDELENIFEETVEFHSDDPFVNSAPGWYDQ